MAVYKGAGGRNYTLDRELGKGGEGSVFTIREAPDSVGKVYVGQKRTSLQERKLRTMLDNPPPLSPVGKLVTIAWPTDILYDNDVFAGFAMPRVGNAYSLRDVYESDTRKRVLPNFTWETILLITINFSKAVNNIHETGHVIGDLNPGNALLDASTGFITLVDTDSYQIHSRDDKRTFNCQVGVAEFLPRELQGVDLGAAARPLHTVQSDRFSLAVLIFAMLMNGTHPFACRSTSTNSLGFNPEIRNIREGRCIFFRRNTDQMDIPLTAPDVSVLPRYIQQLFKRAFVEGSSNPEERPTAEEWVYSLKRLQKELAVCFVNKAHLYYSALMWCPWCEMETNLQQTMGDLMAQTTLTTKTYVPIAPQPSITPPLVQQSKSKFPRHGYPGLSSSSTYIPSASGSDPIDKEGRKKYFITLLTLGGIMGGIAGFLYWNMANPLTAGIVQGIINNLSVNYNLTTAFVGIITGLVVNWELYDRTLHLVDKGHPKGLWIGLRLGCVLPIVGVILLEFFLLCVKIFIFRGLV